MNMNIKFLSVSMALLYTTTLSGCAVPYIVADIVNEVQAGKRFDKAQKKELIATVDQYIEARNLNDKKLIAHLSTTSFIAPEPTTKTVTSFKRIWDHQVQVSAQVAVIWTSYGMHAADGLSQCGKQVFNLEKVNNTWKISHTSVSHSEEKCSAS
jgi:hypothetical protein